MNKFNLTFNGEIIAGQDLAEVKLRFGSLYSIEDPVRLDRFFSGETVILRRNLERKEAARCYHELHLLGAVAALVKVTTSDTVNELVNAQAATKKAVAVKGSAPAQAAKENSLPRRSAKSARTPATSAARGNAARPVSQNWVNRAPPQKPRDSVDIAAAIKARKLESQRAAAEQVAQEQAALAEQQRRIQQEAERQAQLQQRLAEEASAQRAAQEVEDRRRAAEEEARKAAEIAAIKQREAEEAARKAAEIVARKQREAEEAARKAAEEAAVTQRKAEEEARKKAEKAEARRKAAAEEAQRKAQRKREKEERARQKAEEEARRKAELEAQQRRQAEEDARRKAEQAEQERREAEEIAWRGTQQAELKRREAEEDARLQAELAAIKRREEAEAARLQAELEAKAREAAAQAEHIKRETQRLQAEAQRNSTARRRAAAEALAAQQVQRVENGQQSKIPAAEPDSPTMVTAKPGSEQTSTIGAQPASSPTPFKAQIKTTLEVPQRITTPHAETVVIPPRKRQPGAPNLYQLRPFRANEEVRSRAERAQQFGRMSYTIGLLALAALLFALGSFLQRPIETQINGARAMAAPPHDGPVLVAGDTLLFHDRAGNSTTVKTLAEMQLAALEPPLAFDSEGVLYARGRLAGGEPGDTSLRLLRCDPPLAACREFSEALRQYTIDAFVLNPVDGSVLLVDASAGLLLKAGHDSKILANAAIALPPQPVLQLHGGLLLINSAAAPALSVFRYEDKAFGQQLDEILLLPPAITEAEQLRVGNFLWSGDAWWVSLRDGTSGAERLHRFDDSWNYINEVAVPQFTDALQLTAWGTKTLVSDAQHVAMERFNAQGSAEAQFVSGKLDALKTAQQRRLGLSSTAWHSSLVLCAIIAALGLALGYLNTLRGLVYHARRESGAEPIDGYADALDWVDPAANRRATLRRRTISYCLLALGLVVVAIALSVTVSQMAALLIALSGPLIALLWLGRTPIGHVGAIDERLALVDHNGMYHIAGGSRIQHCGRFLCIDDVLVFTGTHNLPAFSPAQLKQQVEPLTVGGVKVDYRTVLVKLIQSRHPLAVGAFAILGAAAAAMLMLSLHGIF